MFSPFRGKGSGTLLGRCVTRFVAFLQAPRRCIFFFSVIFHFFFFSIVAAYSRGYAGIIPGGSRDSCSSGMRSRSDEIGKIFRREHISRGGLLLRSSYGLFLLRFLSLASSFLDNQERACARALCRSVPDRAQRSAWTDWKRNGSSSTILFFSFSFLFFL